MSNNRLLHVLGIKPFLFLWLAEVFSQIATNILNFIFIILAFKLTNSSAAVSGIVLSFTIPPIFLGLLAGVYVDRWDKKRVLFITNIARALLLCSLTIFHSSLLIIYVFSFLITIITQFFIPAEVPMIPVLVRKDLLFTANALFGIGVYGSALIGYALSGPLFILVGQNSIFIVLSLLFLIAAFFISLIQTDNANKQRTSQKGKEITVTVKDELKIAFALITSTRRIYQSLFFLTLSQIIILMLAVIGPGFAKQILGIDVNQFPLFFATPAAFGMVIGGFVIGNYFHNKSRSVIIQIGLFLSAFAIISLPLASRFASRTTVHTLNLYLPHILTINILHVMVVLAFILGFANALVFVPSN